MSLKQVFFVVVALIYTAYSSAASLDDTDRIIHDYVERGWFSGNVLIAKSGEQLSTRSFGFANIADNIPNNPSIRFNIGSIAKHYTAVLVLQMIEQGNLSYETTLSEFDLGLDDAIATNSSLHREESSPDQSER